MPLKPAFLLAITVLYYICLALYVLVALKWPSCINQSLDLAAFHKGKPSECSLVVPIGCSEVLLTPNGNCAPLYEEGLIVLSIIDMQLWELSRYLDGTVCILQVLKVNVTPPSAGPYLHECCSHVQHRSSFSHTVAFYTIWCSCDTHCPSMLNGWNGRLVMCIRKPLGFVVFLHLLGKQVLVKDGYMTAVFLANTMSYETS